jgi:streptomycin 6-kinase
MAPRVVAVEAKDDAAPLEAMLLESGRHGEKLVHWWEGHASETVDTQLDTILRHREWRAHEMDLPDDWEEGYLKAEGGVIRFEHGRPPK